MQDSNSTAALETEYMFVGVEISRFLDKLNNEAKELEANVKLDKNLEHRGRSELNTSDEFTRKAQEYVSKFADDISKSLVESSNNILIGIGGVAIFMFCAVSAYKILSI